MLKLRRDIPQREQDLQDSLTRALDQMILHQRAGETLQEFIHLPVAGPFLRRQASHHFEMASSFRALAGDLWRMWQDEIRAREALMAEIEGVVERCLR